MSEEEAKSPEDSEEANGDGLLHMTRRKFLWLTGAGVVGALAVGRFGCYSTEQWEGQVLARWEAHTMAAAALALIPDEPGRWPTEGPTPWEVAANVDRYLSGMPQAMLREIRGMFVLIEQGTLLGCGIRRFTRLPAAKRLDVLLTIRDRGEMFALAFEGIRALCYVGWYQDDHTWQRLGYDGLMIQREGPPAVPTPEQSAPYQELVAEPGAVPRGVL